LRIRERCIQPMLLQRNIFKRYIFLPRIPKRRGEQRQ
jgi:hypothetical protein